MKDYLTHNLIAKVYGVMLKAEEEGKQAQSITVSPEAYKEILSEANKYAVPGSKLYAIESLYGVPVSVSEEIEPGGWVMDYTVPQPFPVYYPDPYAKAFTQEYPESDELDFSQGSNGDDLFYV